MMNYKVILYDFSPSYWLLVMYYNLFLCFIIIWKLICEPSSVSVKPTLNKLRNKFPPYCGLSQPQMVVYMPQISTHKELIQERRPNVLANRLCYDLCGVKLVAATSCELNKWET